MKKIYSEELNLQTPLFRAYFRYPASFITYTSTPIKIFKFLCKGPSHCRRFKKLIFYGTCHFWIFDTMSDTSYITIVTFDKTYVLFDVVYDITCHLQHAMCYLWHVWCHLWHAMCCHDISGVTYNMFGWPRCHLWHFRSLMSHHLSRMSHHIILIAVQLPFKT